MEVIKFEGAGYTPLQKPCLTVKTAKRNRSVRAIHTIVLLPWNGSIFHVIEVNTDGFIVDHPEDFSLHRIDRAFINGNMCESDEAFVIFEMHVLARVPVKSIQLLGNTLYASS